MIADIETKLDCLTRLFVTFCKLAGIDKASQVWLLERSLEI